MNDKTRNDFASFGLEILKRSVLLVLYETYRERPDEPILQQETIRGHLDIPKGRRGANHLIRGILEILEVEGAVEYNLWYAAGHWQITQKGISVIESDAEDVI